MLAKTRKPSLQWVGTAKVKQESRGWTSVLAKLLAGMVAVGSAVAEKPNIIVIFTDDQGYQDLGCFGSPKIKTPRIDRMADEGIRLTDFQVASSVCSASRASLLTGRIPARHQVGAAFFPGEKGMNPKEVTMAEVLKEAGYRTACFGKWHLGDDRDEVLPIGQGFDEFFGIPFSNDMYLNPDHVFADEVVFHDGFDLAKAKGDQETIRELMESKAGHRSFVEAGVIGRVPVFEGNQVVEYPADQATLTERYIDRTIRFIDESDGEPFFVFVTPAMPHVPLFASEKFKGKSERGIYGDVIEEIDWNVGRLLDHLKKSGHGEDTIVMFTSDNGPWLGKGPKSGSAAPLRDGKFSTYEGGTRMPCVMWWPGKWPAGQVCETTVSALDLLPTFAACAGVPLPDVSLDGVDVSGVLEGKDDAASREFLFYTKFLRLSGVRKGDWKYLRNGGSMHQKPKDGPELYDLSKDLGEQNNLVEQHPEVAKEMEKAISRFEKTLMKK